MRVPSESFGSANGTNLLLVLPTIPGISDADLLEHINRMRTLMGLGWMRRMLRAAADEARERGYRRIDIEQIVNIDPFAEG